MSETSDTGSTATAPGQILKRAREGKNLTVAAIATLMNLDLRTIEALERGDPSKLPAPIFVRGYLRGYARLVGVAEAAVLDAYKAQAPQEPMPRSVGMSRVPMRPAFRAPAISFKAILTVLFLLVAGWIGVEWGPDLIARVGGDAGKESAEVVEPLLTPDAEQAASDAPEASYTESSAGQPIAQTEALSGTDLVLLALPEPQPVPIAEEPAPVAQAEPELPVESDFATPAVAPAEEAPASTAAPGAGEHRLELQFSGDSWVEVRSAEGQTLVLGLLRKGETRSVTGKAPLKVVLGNAAAVEVRVDGEVFEHKRHTRDNIARFEIQP